MVLTLQKEKIEILPYLSQKEKIAVKEYKILPEVRRRERRISSPFFMRMSNNF